MNHHRSIGFGSPERIDAAQLDEAGAARIAAAVRAGHIVDVERALDIELEAPAGSTVRVTVAHDPDEMYWPHGESLPIGTIGQLTHSADNGPAREDNAGETPRKLATLEDLDALRDRVANDIATLVQRFESMAHREGVAIRRNNERFSDLAAADTRNANEINRVDREYDRRVDSAHQRLDAFEARAIVVSPRTDTAGEPERFTPSANARTMSVEMDGAGDCSGGRHEHFAGPAFIHNHGPLVVNGPGFAYVSDCNGCALDQEQHAALVARRNELAREMEQITRQLAT